MKTIEDGFIKEDDINSAEYHRPQKLKIKPFSWPEELQNRYPVNHKLLGDFPLCVCVCVCVFLQHLSMRVAPETASQDGKLNY